MDNREKKEKKENINILGQDEHIFKALNELYGLPISKELLTLPKIVVVGMQSCGKSSVLESLSGVNLPRGDKMCTKMPMVVKMKRGERLIKVNGEEADENNLAQKILAIQLQKLGKQRDVSSDEITIEVFGEELFDLTVIDLPGLVENDLKSKIDKLVGSYVKQEECIILCVYSAEMDVETVKVIPFAEQYDPSGKRTIRVITKIDRCQTSENVVKELNNNQQCFVLRNRSPQERNSNASLSDAHKKEEEHFGNEIFKDVREKCGINNLASQLSEMMKKKLVASFPQVVREIRENEEETKKELQEIGEESWGETLQEKSKNANEKNTKINLGLVRFLDEERDPERDLLKVRDMFGKWGKNVDKNFENLKKDKNEVDKLMKEIQCNSKSHLTPFEVNPSVLKNKIKKSLKGLFDCAKDLLDNVTEKVEEILSKVCENAVPTALPKAKSMFFEILRGSLEHCKGKTLKQILFYFDRQEDYLFTNMKVFEKKQGIEAPTVSRRNAMNLQTDIDAYRKVLSRRFYDEIPFIIMHHLIRLLKEECEKNLSDALFSSFEKFKENKVLRRMQYSSAEEILNDCFSEEEDIIEKRKMLKSKLEGFSKAKKIVNRIKTKIVNKKD